MPSTIKKILVAVALGLGCYAAIELVSKGGLALPSAAAQFSALVIIVITTLAASFLGAAFGGAGAGDKETGTVKWFSLRKGYGFITRDLGDDIFVHLRSIQGRNSLSEGQRVSFSVISSDKGPEADQVTVL